MGSSKGDHLKTPKDKQKGSGDIKGFSCGQRAVRAIRQEVAADGSAGGKEGLWFSQGDLIQAF